MAWFGLWRSESRGRGIPDVRFEKGSSGHQTCDEVGEYHRVRPPVIVGNRMVDYPNRNGEDIVRLAATGLIAAGVVHDFGNLMQVVASAIRLTEKNLDQDAVVAVQPFLQAALASIDRASAISSQALGFSRSEHVPEEVTCLRTALADFKRYLSWMLGSSIEIDLVLEKQLPTVFCSVRELENVLLNLAFNARDAMPEGGRLCISANRGREDEKSIGGGPTAILRVTDTGCGMSREDAKRAFTPYFTTKAPGRGTGLGLAMVSDFARRTGGSAEIETEIGFGTSVVLRLPGCEPLADYK